MADNSGGRMWCSIPERFQLHVAMLALQFGYAGFHVVSRAALNMGVSKLVFPVYRNIIAFLLLLPFAYFLEKKERPAITLNFLLQFFCLALVGITANQGFYLLGLDNTSPTFASAIQNSVPAITFLMAVILRIEQVRLNRKDGIGKVVGTLFCVLGASVITLYKGPTIYSPVPPLHNNSGSSNSNSNSIEVFESISVLGDAKGKNWTLGCLYLIGHCLSWSGWLVLQAPVLKKDAQAWIFQSGGEVFTILYAGVVASGIAFAVQIWCIDRGGPVFVAVYQPVQTLVVAIMASLALGEEFYLGGIIGAGLIIVGLYLVLWGKNEEKKFARELAAITSSSTPENSNSIIRSSSHHAKTSLAQPLLPSSTENV
ncbi:protein WALLS ARE THIN [Trifolium repens]|nr:protein WALLS ARE THIN [Trifolium repens]